MVFSNLLIISAVLLAPALAAAQSAQPAPRAEPPAAAAPAEASPAPARTWVVSCAPAPAAPPRECRLSATAVVQPQNQRLLTVMLVRQPETRSLAMVFQVAHGVALPSGLSWQVDDAEAQRLVFQSSDPEGVYAGIPVADDLLAALRRGTALRVSFLGLPRRDTVTVSVPLAQFGEASAELFAAERQATP